MRHRVAHRKLGRTTPHRIALLRNLATISPGSMIGEYARYNMQRMITLTANIAGADLGSVAREVNRVLRELGALLQSHIRGGDIACRYGGEEFTLILPETPLEVVSQRAIWDSSSEGRSIVTLVTFRVGGWPAQAALDELGARVFAIARTIKALDALRISVGFFNSEDEIRFAVAQMTEIVETGTFARHIGAAASH